MKKVIPYCASRASTERTDVLRSSVPAFETEVDLEERLKECQRSLTLLLSAMHPSPPATSNDNKTTLIERRRSPSCSGTDSEDCRPVNEKGRERTAGERAENDDVKKTPSRRLRPTGKETVFDFAVPSAKNEKEVARLASSKEAFRSCLKKVRFDLNCPRINVLRAHRIESISRSVAGDDPRSQGPTLKPSSQSLDRRLQRAEPGVKLSVERRSKSLGRSASSSRYEFPRSRLEVPSECLQTGMFDANPYKEGSEDGSAWPPSKAGPRCSQAGSAVPVVVTNDPRKKGMDSNVGKETCKKQQPGGASEDCKIFDFWRDVSKFTKSGEKVAKKVCEKLEDEGTPEVSTSTDVLKTSSRSTKRRKKAIKEDKKNMRNEESPLVCTSSDFSRKSTKFTKKRTKTTKEDDEKMRTGKKFEAFTSSDVSRKSSESTRSRNKTTKEASRKPPRMAEYGVRPQIERKSRSFEYQDRQLCYSDGNSSTALEKTTTKRASRSPSPRSTKLTRKMLESFSRHIQRSLSATPSSQVDSDESFQPSDFPFVEAGPAHSQINSRATTLTCSSHSDASSKKCVFPKQHSRRHKSPSNKQWQVDSGKDSETPVGESEAELQQANAITHAMEMARKKLQMATVRSTTGAHGASTTGPMCPSRLRLWQDSGVSLCLKPDEMLSGTENLVSTELKNVAPDICAHALEEKAANEEPQGQNDEKEEVSAQDKDGSEIVPKITTEYLEEMIEKVHQTTLDSAAEVRMLTNKLPARSRRQSCASLSNGGECDKELRGLWDLTRSDRVTRKNLKRNSMQEILSDGEPPTKIGFTTKASRWRSRKASSLTRMKYLLSDLVETIESPANGTTLEKEILVTYPERLETAVSVICGSVFVESPLGAVFDEPNPIFIEEGVLENESNELFSGNAWQVEETTRPEVTIKTLDLITSVAHPMNAESSCVISMSIPAENPLVYQPNNLACEMVLPAKLQGEGATEMEAQPPLEQSVSSVREGGDNTAEAPVKDMDGFSPKLTTRPEVTIKTLEIVTTVAQPVSVESASCVVSETVSAGSPLGTVVYHTNNLACEMVVPVKGQNGGTTKMEVQPPLEQSVSSVLNGGKTTTENHIGDMDDFSTRPEVTIKTLDIVTSVAQPVSVKTACCVVSVSVPAGSHLDSVVNHSNNLASEMVVPEKLQGEGATEMEAQPPLEQSASSVKSGGENTKIYPVGDVDRFSTKHSQLKDKKDDSKEIKVPQKPSLSEQHARIAVKKKWKATPKLKINTPALIPNKIEISQETKNVSRLRYLRRWKETPKLKKRVEIDNLTSAIGITSKDQLLVNGSLLNELLENSAQLHKQPNAISNHVESGQHIISKGCVGDAADTPREVNDKEQVLRETLQHAPPLYHLHNAGDSAVTSQFKNYIFRYVTKRKTFIRLQSQPKILLTGKSLSKKNTAVDIKMKGVGNLRPAKEVKKTDCQRKSLSLFCVGGDYQKKQVVQEGEVEPEDRTPTVLEGGEKENQKKKDEEPERLLMKRAGSTLNKSQVRWLERRRIALGNADGAV